MAPLDESTVDDILLSICIATFRRGDFIGATLDTIVPQLQPRIELLILDGGSPDDTESVVKGYLSRHPNIVYRREQTNSGVDIDYDKAVSRARGQYCWLMTDDDLLEPDALARVTQALVEPIDLLIVNAQVYDKSFSNELHDRLLPVQADRTFEPAQTPEFFLLVANYLTFIGAVIIRRTLWMSRVREPYFGSNFIHVGVIFQAPMPGKTKILARPLIRIRYGNAQWSARSFDIWMCRWPALIWSFEGIPQEARAAITRRHPQESAKRLLWLKAIGVLGPTQQNQLLLDPCSSKARILARVVARLPAAALNLALGVYCLFSTDPFARLKLFELARAPCGRPLMRALARLRGVHVR
jgi:abequosyltransferase